MRVAWQESLPIKRAHALKQLFKRLCRKLSHDKKHAVGAAKPQIRLRARQRVTVERHAAVFAFDVFHMKVAQFARHDPLQPESRRRHPHIISHRSPLRPVNVLPASD